MKKIVIVGGGYAGINLLHQLKKIYDKQLGKTVSIILIDKHAFHFRKVLLFKRIVQQDIDLSIPLTNYTREGVTFLQGEVVEINKEENYLILDGQNQSEKVRYDQLMLTLGSSSHSISGKGGMILKDTETAERIRAQITQSLADQAKVRVAVVGAGITGIETAAEIATWLNSQVGVQNEVILFNSEKCLLSVAPEKVAQKLENKLANIGVKVVHQCRVESYDEDKRILSLVNDDPIPIDVCVWTTGIKANSGLHKLHLPQELNGQLTIEADYRLQGSHNIYAIGDCAKVKDFKMNKCDNMTCKEAIYQAGRLSKVMKRHLEGKMNHSSHKTYPINLFCISLGEEEAFVWMKKWKMNIVLTSGLARYLRKYTWDSASLVQ